MLVPYKAKFYIVGTNYYRITKEAFSKAGKYEETFDLDKSDIVIFTGGEDIQPSLYNEKSLGSERGCYYAPLRDTHELSVLKLVVPHQNKFLVGICRGAQLLCCYPNGGKLWQDVGGHGNGVHSVFDVASKTVVKLNSVHHQMMRPTPDGEILAFAKKSTWKTAEGYSWKGDPDVDPEVVWFPKTRSFCFQAHPEFGHEETHKYFFHLMDKLYWGIGEKKKEATAA